MNPRTEILRMADQGDDSGAGALIKNTSVNELSMSILDDGTNILQCLAARNKPALVRLVIEKGLGVDMCDNEGVSPLMSAALELSHDAVFTLLFMRACPDLQDKIGMTALHWSLGCLSHERDHVVKMLIESGADYQIRDNENKTARDIAVEMTSTYPGYKFVVSMIDAEEYKFFLWMSRKIHERPPRRVKTVYTFYNRICRKIRSIGNASSQTQKAVFTHVATQGLNYDMFIELMSLF